MKQVQITEYGSPEVLNLIEKEVPQPQAGEVLIKVKAVGVNYSDILRRKNTYFMPTPLPFVLGAEAVGEIIETGKSVTLPPFEVGSLVLAILPIGGGYTEYIIANAQYCVPLPPHIDPKEATAIFVQGTSAYLMLHQIAKEMEGKTILVHAAAGGVGSLLVQLGKLAGAKVIGTTSSDKKSNAVKELGADKVINYSNPDWAEKLIAENNGEKVDYIFEMVGGEIYAQSFACLKQGGIMIVYGAASGEKGLIHSEHFVDESHNLLSFNLAYFIQNKPEVWQASLGAMIELIAQGKLKVKTSDNYALTDAEKAHQAIENRETIGKVVLIP